MVETTGSFPGSSRFQVSLRGGSHFRYSLSVLCPLSHVTMENRLEHKKKDDFWSAGFVPPQISVF